MPAIRVIDRLQDLSDYAGTPSDGQVLKWDAGTGKFAPVSPNALAGLVALAPSTAARNIVSPSADVLPFGVRARAGQTANLLEVQDSNGTPFFTIKGDGSGVGIGTNNPRELLHVAGHVLLDNNCSLRSKDSGGTKRPLLYLSATDNLYLNGVSGVSDIYIGPTSPLAMVVKGANGRVGLGTATPATRLHVGGTTNSDYIRTDTGLDLNYVAAPTAPTLALVNAPGNVDAGQHFYYVTYVTALGETDVYGQVAPSVTTDAANGQVDVTIPVSSDPRVIARRIYRSKSGTPAHQAMALGVVNDNTTTVFRDNYPDANLLTTALCYFRPNATNRGIVKSGSSVLTLDYNLTAIGPYAGSMIAAGGGGRSVFIGMSAGQGVTSGNDNTFVGHSAGANVTTGSSNAAFGYGAMLNGGGGTLNTAIGHDALVYMKDGSYNTALGGFSGFWLRGGSYNTLLGSNISVGRGANTDFDRNTVIGYNAGYNLAGSRNVFLGFGAGYSETGSDRLYIANSTANVLIYGEFDTAKLKFNARVLQNAPATAPDDADLANGQVSFYLDEAGNNLKVRVRYSNGTLKTGTVALA